MSFAAPPSSASGLPQNDKTPPPKAPEDGDLANAVVTQLSILVTTLSDANWAASYKQIRYILDHHAAVHPAVFTSYLAKLVGIVNLSAGSPAPPDSLSVTERLFREELNLVAADLVNLDVLFVHLSTLFLVYGYSIADFITRFDCEVVLSYLIVIKFQEIDPEFTKSFIEENIDTLFEAIKNRDSSSSFNWTLVLDYILQSPDIPLPHKLLTLGALKAFSRNIPPVSRFYRSVLKMSFKEFLLEMGPENLLPERLLPGLLQIMPEDIDLSIALLLAEVLIPGSQGLSKVDGGVTNFTFVNNLPEANAKGAQLQAGFRMVDADAKFTLNWYDIFAKVQENLFDSAKRDLQPTVATMTQFLASLDFKPGLIDIFLSYDWWFNKPLLFILHSLDPQQGAFDIKALKNMTLAFENDPEVTQPRRNVLRFLSVGKLELLVFSQISEQLKLQISEREAELNRVLGQVFEFDYMVHPEYLAAAALSMPEKPPFVVGLLEKIFVLHLDDEALDFSRILAKFKELDPDLAVSHFTDYYTKKATPEAVGRVVSLAAGAGLLDSLLQKTWALNINPVAFAVDASNYGYDLRPEIDARLQDQHEKGPLYQALLSTLEVRATQDYEKGQLPGAAETYKVLKVPVVYFLLEKLKGSKGLIDAERLKNLQLLLLTTYPRLINFGCGHDEAILQNERQSYLFPLAVEQEMKAYYSKMYNKEMEITDIVAMLVRMKVLDVPHDQDVFACMIHSLLDEYRFFSEYPLTALASTSLLFGALLQKDLIQGTTLTVALNFIWELCNQPQDLHLFKFAVQLLYNFKSRLHEYPIYCKHLLECQSLLAHAKMYQIVKDASNGIACPDAASTASNDGTPAPKGESGPVYQLITVSKKAFSGQETPNETTSDKLLFFVNNLTSDNLTTKLADVKDLLMEKHHLWFANYLVGERAKAEPNNHQLYADMVAGFDNYVFNSYVLLVSLQETENLIRNFKDSVSERQQLKNMGLWLGKITLARDKPLRRDQVALKFLLVEAYDFKTLHLVIPFVCRILDQARHLRVFRPPNPWVLGVLRVLAELYECADLKLNLKFEIEVLLNAFDLKIADIEASTVIRAHTPTPQALAAMFGVHSDAGAVASDLSRLALEEIPEPQLHQLQVHQQNQLLLGQGMQPPVPTARAAPEEPQLDTSFSQLIGNTVFTQNPNLRRAFQASLSRAVRECAVPILSRVSEAVLTTTEALVRKDFAAEPDPVRFRKSYQILAQQLAHSMVVCSGRKILSETIEATMLQLLGSQNPQEVPMAELGLAVLQNVDLCVEIVDKVAAGNISELIDDRMQKLVLERERHPSGATFVDKDTPDYALKLPAPLGLAPGGLSAGQLAIYESFGTNGPLVRPETAAETPAAAPASVALPVAQVAPVAQQPMVQQEDASVDQLFAAITQSCERAIHQLGAVKETKLADLGPEHPIMVALSHALAVAQANALKFPELLLKVAQYAVNCLFTQAHENPMSNEIYVVVLDKLCEYLPSTAKDVTWWLVHLLDQRKFNMPVIYLLLKVQLVQATKLDLSIGRLISDSNSPVVVQFAASLLLNVFSSPELRPIALRLEFGFTLDALARFSGDSEEAKASKQARDDLFELLRTQELPSIEKPRLYSQMGYVFAEWVKLLTHGDTTDALQTQFVDGLLHHGILTDPDYFEAFFKAATEVSTTAFSAEHELRTRTQREVYLAVDTFAMLIVKIVLRFDKEHPKEAAEYLRNVFGIVILVLAHDHETAGASWNERAYFRLFSLLLSSWKDALALDSTATSHLDELFYPLVGEVLHLLQPIVYPGFTFAWISLVAHRMFLPQLLELPSNGGYSTAVKLLTAVLKFEGLYGNEDLPHDVLSVVFKAVNRIFTGLAHDYPDFLVQCHYQLVTATPRNYIQLRNIILSATPADVPVVDPFTQGLKVERLPAINDLPLVEYQPVDDLAKVGLKKPVDNFLRIPAPALMRSIYSGTRLNHPKETADFGFSIVHYNVKLINALVLHVGILAVADKLPGNGRGFNTKSSHVALLVDLVNHGLGEFKFHVINAIANQLRYANSHTHWFVGIILHFFSCSSLWGTAGARLVIQELITRVLLERQVVNKPHPWGLTIVFTELVKNTDYGFFELPFVKDAAPELRLIFDALAKNVRA